MSANGGAGVSEFYDDFKIEFGNATANGFANFNEFHVLEYASANVRVFGTFSEVLFP